MCDWSQGLRRGIGTSRKSDHPCWWLALTRRWRGLAGSEGAKSNPWVSVLRELGWCWSVRGQICGWCRKSGEGVCFLANIIGGRGWLFNRQGRGYWWRARRQRNFRKKVVWWRDFHGQGLLDWSETLGGLEGRVKGSSAETKGGSSRGIGRVRVWECVQKGVGVEVSSSLRIG